MKKITFFLVLIMLFSLAGCNDGNTADFGSSSTNKAEQEDASSVSDDVIEIKDNFFIAQCNDIYLNADSYEGKKVRYEGIFNKYTNPDNNVTYYSVIRQGPGCCGNDGVAGFQVQYDGTWPEHEDWVAAEGVVKISERDGFNTVILYLSSLETKSQRGQEYVTH